MMVRLQFEDEHSFPDPFLFHFCQELHGPILPQNGALTLPWRMHRAKKDLLSTHSNVACPSEPAISRRRAAIIHPKLKTSISRLLVSCAALVSSSSLFCGLPCLGTRQFVTFLCVSMKPQQSPESFMWPHVGTRSSGGIRKVSPHASSIELRFAFPRSRKAEVLKSPAMMSASLRSVNFLSWPRSLLCNVSPLRSRVAQVRRDRCVGAVSMS